MPVMQASCNHGRADWSWHRRILKNFVRIFTNLSKGLFKEGLSVAAMIALCIYYISGWHDRTAGERDLTSLTRCVRASYSCSLHLLMTAVAGDI